MLAAVDCRKKKSKQKKKALPKPKDLKNKTKPVWRGMERGSYCLGGPWNQSTSVCETFSEKSAVGWLRALFFVFPTSVYILGFEFAWILAF